MILSWKETRSGIVNVDERLPWGQTIAMGFQHVLAMFGATVVAPILMGFDPNLAILFSGIGTLIFFAFVGGAVPSYLGSSFAFIGPVAAVTGTAAASGAANGIGLALGGIIAAGVVYTLIGLDRPSDRRGLDRQPHAAAGHRRGGGRHRAQPGAGRAQPRRGRSGDRRDHGPGDLRHRAPHHRHLQPIADPDRERDRVPGGVAPGRDIHRTAGSISG